jgi:rubrerythrin
MDRYLDHYADETRDVWATLTGTFGNNAKCIEADKVWFCRDCGSIVWDTNSPNQWHGGSVDE